jgi:hypothetical protein
MSNRFRRAARLARLLATFSALGVLKHVVSLPTLVRWASRPPSARATRAADDILSDVVRAGAFGGWPDRDCLQRSLLLYRELTRAGWRPELVVGFERGAAGLLGHAWVRADGRVIGDGDAAVARFEPALIFGADGALRTGAR